jgi:CHAT domain-containing protein/Tfp pilus assembly protein PilF
MSRPPAALIFSVIVLAGAACRGTSSGPTNLDADLAAAREVQVKQGPRAAITLYERVLTSARSSHSRRHEGLALGQMGTAYKNLGDYTRAMELHKQALAIKRETGDQIEIAKTLSNMGLVDEAEGNCEEALTLYAQSLDIFTRSNSPRFAASVLNNQGLCYDAIGDFRRSTDTYQRALALHRQQGNEIGESETLGNLGGVALLLGHFDDAAKHYEQSLAISTRVDARQSMVLDLINLGLARSGMGEFQVAREHFERARSLAGGAGLLREEADASKGLANWLEQAGRYDDARKMLSEAAAIYARAGLAREQIEATHALGLLDLDTGDLGQAAAAFERASSEAARLKFHNGQLAAQTALAALELRRHNPDAAAAAAERVERAAGAVGDGASLASARTWLSRIRLAQRRPDAAVAAATMAVDAAEKSTGPIIVADARVALADALASVRRTDAAVAQYDTVLQDGAARSIPDLVWRASLGRGRAYETQGRLDQALSDLLHAADSIEQVRSQLSAERARTGFLDDKRDVYAALVRLLLRMGRTREAFQAAEQLRAQGYRELIERSLALGRTNSNVVPAALLARIRQLQASMETELRRPAHDRRGQAVTVFRQELHAAEAAWSTAVGRLDRDASWRGVLTRHVPLPVERIQRRLPRDAALVEFVLDLDETAVFVLTRTSVRARLLPVGRSVLRTRIELLRGLLARQEATGWQDVAERLDQDLIDPLRRAGWLRNVSRLYVVPHGELNYLPFAALRHETRSGARLLVDDLAVVSLPAAEALVQSVSRGSSTRPLLALAPGRTRLPFARQEVESLAELFPNSREVLVGKDATEARFKQDAGRFRVLHLATHGFFNRLDPLFSGVELEPTAADDGRLQVFEILGLPLAADLVTLSACDTALGGGELSDLPAGEELIGLTRAFLSAGSRNVLATLWEINDRTTSPLMTDFYRAARTRPFPEALAFVQRRHAHSDGPHAHPWHWAAFMIAEGRQSTAETGNARP